MTTNYFRIKKVKIYDSTWFLVLWLMGIGLLQLFIFIIVVYFTNGYGIPFLMIFVPPLAYYLANKVARFKYPPLQIIVYYIFMLVMALATLFSWIK